MNKYTKNSYNAAAARKAAGFRAFDVGGNLYAFWPDGDLSKWNDAYVQKIDGITLEHIRKTANGKHINIISDTEDTSGEFADILEFKDAKKILAFTTEQKISYKSLLSLKEVTSLEELKLWADFAGQLFDCDAGSVFACFQNDLTAKCGRYFMGFDNGKLVAISQTISDDEVTGIYWVGVDESYRRKGYGHDITAFAINSVLDDKMYNFILSATEMGERIYRPMGFKDNALLYKYNFKNG